jgi:hypothetical protein
MEYNTSRSKLLMPEYGRNVQCMVEHLMSIEDPQRRLRNAHAVVEFMATLNPHLKTMEDYEHKLWDHLYQMTDFQLNVNGPYPPPLPEAVFKKPEPLPYPTDNKRNKHLGRNFTAVLEKALAEPDPQRRQGFTQMLGYYMKLSYTNWHREPVHDDMIRSELLELSGGLLHYEQSNFKVHFDLRTVAGGGGKQNRGGGNNRNFNNGNRNRGKKKNKKK